MKTKDRAFLYHDQEAEEKAIETLDKGLQVLNRSIVPFLAAVGLLTIENVWRLDAAVPTIKTTRHTFDKNGDFAGVVTDYEKLEKTSKSIEETLDVLRLDYLAALDPHTSQLEYYRAGRAFDTAFDNSNFVARSSGIPENLKAVVYLDENKALQIDREKLAAAFNVYIEGEILERHRAHVAAVDAINEICGGELTESGATEILLQLFGEIREGRVVVKADRDLVKLYAAFSKNS